MNKMQPILVLNHTFGNNVLIIVVMGKRAIPRPYSASSVTGGLLKSLQPVLLPIPWSIWKVLVLSFFL